MPKFPDKSREVSEDVPVLDPEDTTEKQERLLALAWENPEASQNKLHEAMGCKGQGPFKRREDIHCENLVSVAIEYFAQDGAEIPEDIQEVEVEQSWEPLEEILEDDGEEDGKGTGAQEDKDES